MRKKDKIVTLIENDFLEFFCGKYKSIKFIYLSDTGELFFSWNDCLYKLFFKIEYITKNGNEILSKIADFVYENYVSPNWEDV